MHLEIVRFGVHLSTWPKENAANGIPKRILVAYLKVALFLIPTLMRLPAQTVGSRKYFLMYDGIVANI